MKLSREITPDEIAVYQSTGVVLLKDVLDLQTVNLFRQNIDAATKTLGESSSGYDFSTLIKAAESKNQNLLENSSDGQHDVMALADYIESTGKPYLQEGDGNGSFIVDTAIGERLRGFKRLCINGAAPEIAGALLGSEEVRFYGDQIFVKEPRTRERTAFHQDAPYFEIDGEQCCVLWIPVDPVTLETGAMQYVLGSHRWGKLYQPNVFVSQAPLPGAEGPIMPDIESNKAEYEVVHFDTEPGDVIIHNYKTIHGTGGNSSRYQVRRAASLRFAGDDIRFTSRPWVPKQLHHTHELGEGDKLSGPEFPVVYRRPREQEYKAA